MVSPPFSPQQTLSRIEGRHPSLCDQTAGRNSSGIPLNQPVSITKTHLVDIPIPSRDIVGVTRRIPLNLRKPLFSRKSRSPNSRITIPPKTPASHEEIPSTFYHYDPPSVFYWPSRDPIGERGGINLYGMVGNDAVGKWDYLGLCSITIDVGHGGTQNSRTTERLRDRVEDNDGRGCNRFIAIGCGANLLNKIYEDDGMGVPVVPPMAGPSPNNKTTPGDSDILERNGFRRNDLCGSSKVLAKIDAAIANARLFARKEMCNSCCCKSITIRITCKGRINNPDEFNEYEKFEQERSGRVPRCGTEITVPCKWGMFFK